MNTPQYTMIKRIVEAAMETERRGPRTRTIRKKAGYTTHTTLLGVAPQIDVAALEVEADDAGAEHAAVVADPSVCANALCRKAWNDDEEDEWKGCVEECDMWWCFACEDLLVVHQENCVFCA